MLGTPTYVPVTPILLSRIYSSVEIVLFDNWQFFLVQFSHSEILRKSIWLSSVDTRLDVSTFLSFLFVRFHIWMNWVTIRGAFECVLKLWKHGIYSYSLNVFVCIWFEILSHRLCVDLTLLIVVVYPNIPEIVKDYELLLDFWEVHILSTAIKLESW